MSWQTQNNNRIGGFCLKLKLPDSPGIAGDFYWIYQIKKGTKIFPISLPFIKLNLIIYKHILILFFGHTSIEFRILCLLFIAFKMTFRLFILIISQIALGEYSFKKLSLCLTCFVLHCYFQQYRCNQSRYNNNQYYCWKQIF